MNVSNAPILQNDLIYEATIVFIPVIYNTPWWIFMDNAIGKLVKNSLIEANTDRH